MMRAIVLLMLGSSCVAGCWAPTAPHTQVSFNPLTKTITLYDSKDNDISVDEISYDVGKGGALKKLVIRNNASDVIKQNVALMQEWREQMKVANEGLRIAAEGLSNIARVFAPGVNAALTPRSGPLTEIGKGVGAGLERRIGGGAPASQP